VVVTTAILGALAGSSAMAWALNRRSGKLRQTDPETGPASDQDSSDLGLSRTGPTLLHFSAAWCGPCASVRRVIDQVCADLPDVAHVEIDIDDNAVAAKRLSVLSLPTLFIFDADGRQRYRSAGVPTAADLRTALRPLLS
jgi:thiol-disulfide isomerase/thioredoxin